MIERTAGLCVICRNGQINILIEYAAGLHVILTQRYCNILIDRATGYFQTPANVDSVSIYIQCSSINGKVAGMFRRIRKHNVIAKAERP